MITRIDDVYLYGDGGEETLRAREYLESNGVPHSYLHYGDPDQHKHVYSAVGSWFPDRRDDISVMPFVVYTEEHDGKMNASSPRRILILDEIHASNLPDLVKLG